MNAICLSRSFLILSLYFFADSSYSSGVFRLHLQRVQPFLVGFLLQQLVHFPLPFHLIQTFKHFRNDLDVKVRFRGRVAGWVPLWPACCQDSSTISRTDGFNASEIFSASIRERAADVHRGALRFRAPVPVRSDVCRCRFDFLMSVSYSRLMKVFRGGGRGKRSTRGEHLSQKCEDFTRGDDFNVSSIKRFRGDDFNVSSIKRFLPCFAVFGCFFADDDEGTTRRNLSLFLSILFSRSALSFRQSLDVTVVFVETSIHFVYTLHKWSRQWSKSSACAKSHVCLHFIAACIAAWCNFNTSKYSSSVLISALFTR